MDVPPPPYRIQMNRMPPLPTSCVVGPVDGPASTPSKPHVLLDMILVTVRGAGQAMTFLKPSADVHTSIAKVPCQPRSDRSRLNVRPARRPGERVQLLGVELERGGVDAVALPSRARSILEDVALVRTTDGAMHFDALHEQRSILFRLHVILVNRLPETRPCSRQAGNRLCV